ncbi:MAG: helix-turn-helix transcriptional regulator [Candidatus Doudnabacteria bacterium]|nr:helix-turn-helix transcriptional regulator [Candidatus Doudnabacteria bacterium]
MKNENISYEDIGKRIETARKQEGLTQGQLADMMDYQSPTAISLIEAGKRKIKIAELQKLAQLLHRDMDYLLSGESAPKVSWRIALRSEHKDLTKPELDQIETFVNFIKSEKHGRPGSSDTGK